MADTVVCCSMCYCLLLFNVLLFVAVVQCCLYIILGVRDKFYVLIFCYFLGWLEVLTHATHHLRTWT